MTRGTKAKLWLVLVIIMAAIAIDDTGPQPEPEIGTALVCDPECVEYPPPEEPYRYSTGDPRD